LVAREVEKVIPARDDADPWRATNGVWTAITHVTVRRRDARIYGIPMRDTYYNILRFIDTQREVHP
jgi:nicotinamide mononucleotide adenylyltransferase